MEYCSNCRQGNSDRYLIRDKSDYQIFGSAGFHGDYEDFSKGYGAVYNFK